MASLRPTCYELDSRARLAPALRTGPDASPGGACAPAGKLAPGSAARTSGRSSSARANDVPSTGATWHCQGRAGVTPESAEGSGGLEGHTWG